MLKRPHIPTSSEVYELSAPRGVWYGKQVLLTGHFANVVRELEALRRELEESDSWLFRGAGADPHDNGVMDRLAAARRRLGVR